MRRLASLSFLGALLGAVVPAQQTWIVDTLIRPGAHFDNLPSAVAAAAPGDILRLRASPIPYDSPTPLGVSFNKPLQIMAVDPMQRPRVQGPWYIVGLPLGSVLLVANLEMISAPGIPFLFGGNGNPGTVLLDNIVTTPAVYSISNFGFTESTLVVISNSHLDMRGGIWVRNTTLMMDNTYYRSAHFPASSFILPGQGGNAAIFAEQAKVIVSRSTLIGASATTSSGQAWGAFLMTDADITVAKGCTLEAGFRAGGGRTELDSVWGGQNHIAVDPGTVLVGHLRMGDPRVTTVISPQTGMTYQVTPTTLQVEHYVASAQSISVLGMGALVSTPWTNVVGPVFVDLAGASEYWALPPTVGPVTRTFAIPPGLPLGYQLALQCFDLQAGGTIQTSNAVVAGIRQ